MPKIHIHKTETQREDLVLSNAEWQEAIRAMNLSEFALYLHIASQTDKSPLTLSKQAYEDATGFQKSSYYDAIARLKELGYLVEHRKTQFSFFTRPVRDDGSGQQRKEMFFGETFSH